MRSQKQLIHGLLNKEEFLLIILDACRYDIFEEECWHEGILEPVFSSGTSTWMWLVSTFDEDHYDLTYVSGNPHVGPVSFSNDWLGTEKFTKVIPAWNFGWEEIKGVETVPPWNMTETTMRRKGRVIAHFMQPHWPYIGDFNLEIQSPALSSFREKAIDAVRSKISDSDFREIEPNRKVMYPAGQDLIKAYRSNLRLALKEIKPLFSRKNVVVTADHGELFGENNCVAHSGQIPHPLLKTVPWFEPSEQWRNK